MLTVFVDHPSIRPERRALIVKTKDCATKNFVMVDGKPITVARDVYEAIRLENGRIRRLARREKRCAQTARSALGEPREYLRTWILSKKCLHLRVRMIPNHSLS